MTTPTIPGRAVPAALVKPEGPVEHIGNVLQILRGADVDAHGVPQLTAIEYRGICTRLQWAVDQLERRT